MTDEDGKKGADEAGQDDKSSHQQTLTPNTSNSLTKDAYTVDEVKALLNDKGATHGREIKSLGETNSQLTARLKVATDILGKNNEAMDLFNQRLQYQNDVVAFEGAKNDFKRDAETNKGYLEAGKLASKITIAQKVIGENKAIDPSFVAMYGGETEEEMKAFVSGTLRNPGLATANNNTPADNGLPGAGGIDVNKLTPSQQIAIGLKGLK